MPITKRQETHLKKLIQEYVNAKIELSWIGSKSTEEHHDIRSNARHAGDKLNTYIQRLTE